MGYSVGIKIVKYVFLGIMPLLLISNSGNKLRMEFSPAMNDNLIPSNLEFDWDIEELETGSILNKMSLVFNDVGDTCRMELVMKTKDRKESLNEHEFKIQKVASFLNNNEGVFGYFIHKDYGEKPFFADSGFIRILRLEENRIQGFMDVTLVNDYGKKIRISDNFRNF